jgi:hypothetical protein
MLRLYDCEALSEAFRRNKKEAAKTIKRTIPETSTNVLLGATFVDALFSKQKSQQGLARRFLYYIASSPGRFLDWPDPQSIVPVADRFKPLLAFKGPLALAAEAKELWRAFQLANRARLIDVPDNRPDLAHALSSEPTHVLKVAALFGLAIATAEAASASGRSVGVRCNSRSITLPKTSGLLPIFFTAHSNSRPDTKAKRSWRKSGRNSRGVEDTQIQSLSPGQISPLLSVITPHVTAPFRPRSCISRFCPN